MKKHQKCIPPLHTGLNCLAQTVHFLARLTNLISWSSPGHWLFSRVHSADFTPAGFLSPFFKINISRHNQISIRNELVSTKPARWPTIPLKCAFWSNLSIWKFRTMNVASDQLSPAYPIWSSGSLGPAQPAGCPAHVHIWWIWLAHNFTGSFDIN